MSETSKKKRITRFLRIIIASGLIGILIYRAGISSILQSFSHINPVFALLTWSSLILLLLLGAFNIWLLLRIMHPVPFASFLRSYTYAFAANLTLPGQLGDATLPVFLKKKGIPVGFGSFAYLLDKMVTLSVLCTVAWYGSITLLPEINSIFFLIFPIALILPLAGMILGIYSLNIRWKPLVKIQEIIELTLQKLPCVRRKWYIVCLNVAVTTVKWLILCLCYYLAFRTFDTHVSWPEIGVIPILSTLVGYIPISPGGVGTVEFSAVYLFSLVRIESAVVLSAYLFLRTGQYLIAAILLISPLNPTQKQADKRETCKP